ncbi:MAG: hypothetical protein ACXQTN_05120 [Methanoculleaceae archaeon]
MVPVSQYHKLKRIAELKRIAMERCNDRILQASRTSGHRHKMPDHGDDHIVITSRLKRHHGL